MKFTSTSFAADCVPCNSLRIYTIRSPFVHARFNVIGIKDAEKICGVIRVITANDIPGINVVGPLIRDQPILATGTARFFGEPLALIVAEQDLDISVVVNTLKLESEELPSVISTRAATAPDSPILHGTSNILASRQIVKGSIEKGLQSASVVVERTYEVGWIDHAYLEPESGFAEIDGTRVVVHYPTQSPHYARMVIAEMLAIDPSRVRIVATRIGGGFGGKLEVIPLCHLALAAYLCRQPVSLIYTRAESLAFTTKSHPVLINYITGASADGTLIASKVEFTLDTGAYASYGPGVLTRMAVHALGPYSVPSYLITGQLIYTNNPVAGAMRGFGVAQMAFAYETQMDLLAQKLDIDPFDLRIRNALQTGNQTVTSQSLDFDVGLSRCIQRAKKFSMTLSKDGETPQDDKVRHGVGVAAFLYGIGNTGHINPATVTVEVGLNEKFIIRTSSVDMGQKSNVVLAQIASRELGIPINCTEIISGDTDTTPDSGITSASRTVFYVGNAAKKAANELKNLIFEEASMLVRTDDVAVIGKAFTLTRSHNAKNTIALSEVIGSLMKRGIPLHKTSTFGPDVTSLDINTGVGNPYATYSFGCHVAEVSVDIETGRVSVERYCAIHDSGKIIDMASAIGQVHGGIMMGLGLALLEKCEVIGGRVTNDSFRTYLIPCAADVPKSILVEFVETNDLLGPFGAKGLAEPAQVPAAAAIANAVGNAVGTHLNRLPITAQTLWQDVLRKGYC